MSQRQPCKTCKWFEMTSTYPGDPNPSRICLYYPQSVGVYANRGCSLHTPIEPEQPVTPKPTRSPFEDLPDLTPDVAEALEQFKLCIVRHRASEFRDGVSRETFAQVLEALKSFVLMEVKS